MPSHFQFSLSDFQHSNSFITAVGRNHINKTVGGQPKALKTTRAVDPDIQSSLTSWGYSDIMQNAASTRPLGAQYDLFNQSSSTDLSAILSKEGGGVDALLGGRKTFAPNDIISRSKYTPTSAAPSVDTTVNGATGNYGVAPEGARTTTAVRQIWGNTPATQAQLTTFTWWSGVGVPIRKETVNIWKIVDSIFKKYNYRPLSGQTWGFAARPITGGTGWSLHAFGIAVDINSLKNPYGPTLVTDMPGQMIKEIEAIKSKSGIQAVRWGGRYSNNKDAMHFEIMLTPQEMAAGVVRY